MKRRLGGKCQRAIRYCLWHAPNGMATTAELLEWSHRGGSADLKIRDNQRRAIRRAAEQLGIKVGRSPKGRGRPILWRLKPANTMERWEGHKPVRRRAVGQSLFPKAK